MGVKYNIAEIFKKIKTKIKLSLLLCKNGVNNFEDLNKYIIWTNDLGAYKVVVRQMAYAKNNNYLNFYHNNFIAVNSFLEDAKKNWVKIKSSSSDNPIFKFKNMFIEFETCDCNQEKQNLVLRADNKLYLGFDNFLPITKEK